MLDNTTPETLRERLNSAEAAIQRVLELHAPFTLDKFEYCGHCLDHYESAEWPCETVKAITKQEV